MADLTKLNFRDRYPSPMDFRDLPSSEIGASAVLHIKEVSPGKPFVIADICNGILQGYMRDQITVHENAEIALVEGFQWAILAGLFIPDIRQIAGLWYRLSRAGRDFSLSRLAAIRLQNLLPDFLLHPVIRDASLAIFNTGRFDAAVFEAFRTLETEVRNAAGYAVTDYGTDMISKAFQSEKGPLRYKDRPDAERQALARLMSGAHALFKNPRSHRAMDLNDPHEAAELLIIASHLMRIVDERSAAHRD